MSVRWMAENLDAGPVRRERLRGTTTWIGAIKGAVSTLNCTLLIDGYWLPASMFRVGLTFLI